MICPNRQSISYNMSADSNSKTPVKVFVVFACFITVLVSVVKVNVT
ncbi:hypothetical protein D918_03541 [Trichuris suis]|nr:hypothetical protein D918_03541 [Trichuris suis]